MGKLSESLLKPATAGAISAVISYIMFDGAGSVQIMDNFVPGWILIGVVVAVADFAGTFSANYISPYVISSSESVKNLEDMLLTPSLCGALSWVLLDPSSWSWRIIYGSIWNRLGIKLGSRLYYK